MTELPPPPAVRPLDDTWHSRDLPVLIELARRLEAGERALRASDLARAGFMDLPPLLLAFHALDGPYIEGKPSERYGGGSTDYWAGHLTERGRRAVGLWPSERSGDALVELLRQAEAQTTDDEEKTLLRRAAGAVGSVSQTVMTDVIAALVKSQAGL